MQLTTSRGDVVNVTRTDEEAIAILGTMKSDFARSLVQQHAQRGLSARQWPWVHKLANEHTAPKPEPVENLGGLVALLDTASAALKYPKITLTLDEGPVRLSRAGNGSRAPGSVNVTDGGPFGENEWYGRIERDGTFQPSRSCPAWVRDALIAMNEDPHAFAAQHGQRSGNCCFCNRTLTTDESLAAGYGPVCAERWKLPWG